MYEESFEYSSWFENQVSSFSFVLGPLPMFMATMDAANCVTEIYVNAYDKLYKIGFDCWSRGRHCRPCFASQTETKNNTHHNLLNNSSQAI